jgi:hypothetical protein
LLSVIAGVLAACELSPADSRSQLISEPAARRHGLTRAWFTQARLDRSRARVSHVVLNGGTLFVQTDQATVNAIDAETGQALWAEQIGRRDHPSLTPGVNSDLVAVVNGSFLYVVNRHTGKLLWSTELEEAPGAGAALSSYRAYVPMTTGLMMSYQLEQMEDPLEELGKILDQDLTPEEEEAREAERRVSIRLQQRYVPPLAVKSFGRTMVQPLVTRQTEDEEFVAWPTDRGFLFVARVSRGGEDFAVRYRLETEAGIAAQPTYLPANPDVVGDSGIIYAASRDGFVHAIRERRGDALWRFSAAEPLLQPAVVIGQDVYVVTAPGGMFCLDARNGSEKWWTNKVAQFVAASKNRVYVADKLGRVVVLNRETGTRLDMIPAEGLDIKLLNNQTDRIYLVSGTGLVQCFHEMELTEPIRHAELEPSAPDAPEPPPAPPGPAKGPPQPVDQSANPFRKIP